MADLEDKVKLISEIEGEMARFRAKADTDLAQRVQEINVVELKLAESNAKQNELITQLSQADKRNLELVCQFDEL